MATTYNSSYSRNDLSYRSGVQKITLGLGVVFIAVGLLGIIMPGFMGMHLSMSHNLIHIVSGALSIWASKEHGRARSFAMVFGVVYGLLGLAGFIIGQPGYPGVGHMEADQNLFRLIPNVLEFGTMDHGVHLILSALYIMSALASKPAYRSADESIVREQTRDTGIFTTNTTGSNAGTGLDDASLGRNDVDRLTDRERRSNFENRL